MLCIVDKQAKFTTASLKLKLFLNKKSIPYKGTYHFNGNDEKEFEIEYNNLPSNEEDNNRLLQLLDHSWRLIKEGGKLGVNGVKRFFTVLFPFAITNIILFFYGLSRLFSTDFEFSKIGVVILVFILGLGVTIYATYRTYQYVIIDTMRVIYENLIFLFSED